MTTLPTSTTLQDLDESTISRVHWRIVITAGMGFFTDAYDLFVIGVATAILQPIWHLTVMQLALLNGVSLAAAAVGALGFGYMADRFGRKKMYGFEVLILFVGAIISALSPNFLWLVIARIIVGLGIGGDYPTSAVVVSEYSTRKHRGFLVLLVFAMQALGLIVGPLIASLFLAMDVPAEWTWRILLGIGAIPAASVFYLRRRMKETPHFSLAKKTPVVAVSRVVSDLAGYTEKQNNHPKKHSMFRMPWVKYLIGTAGAWFLLDVAFYGNGVSSVLIMKSIDPSASLLKHTLLSALMFLFFAVPGYLLAAFYVDKIGRKTLQMLGFFVMAVCFITIAMVPYITQNLPMFIAIFGLSFFFVNFGPNTTTFLIPSEIYPTSIRASAHGFSAAIGKVGAFVGAFILPPLLATHDLSFTLMVMAFVSIAGILITPLVPEMKNVSLTTTDAHVHKPKSEGGEHFALAEKLPGTE